MLQLIKTLVLCLIVATFPLLLISILNVLNVQAAEPIIEISGENTLYSGLYSSEWDSTLDFYQLNVATGGTPLTFSGTFHDLYEDGIAIPGPVDYTQWSNTREVLNNAWLGHTTPVANINGHDSMESYANGTHDEQMLFWAKNVKQFLDMGEGRSVIIAPFQEMNGSWVSYGCDPASYKIAYTKMVTIFRDVLNIDETQVRFAFAPNGWMSSSCGTSHAAYYPDANLVDVIGFSGFNFGLCVANITSWDSVTETLENSIDILSTIDATKPLIVLQTAATRPENLCGGSQDIWTHNLFEFLAQKPNVVGFIWFNFLLSEGDYRIWDKNWVSSGWVSGSHLESTTHHWPLTHWFTPGRLTLASASGTFFDDDDSIFESDIEWLAASGITRGCSTNMFCPTSYVTRGQMAAFLHRAYGDIIIPTFSSIDFVDITSTAFQEDIAWLSSVGITRGCASDMFCPNAYVTREQLAAFLHRALQDHIDALGSIPDFVDITDNIFESDIKWLASSNITRGCEIDKFCPTSYVTREQMAAFLHRVDF